MTDTPAAAPDPAAPERTAPSTATGLDPRLAGLLAYVFGLVGSGLVVLLTQKHPEVRFHGAQSILFSVAAVVLALLTSMISTGLNGLVVFLLVGTWVLMCIKGHQLDHFKLPVIGDAAEKIEATR